jgi:hypothetical protein
MDRASFRFFSSSRVAQTEDLRGLQLTAGNSSNSVHRFAELPDEVDIQMLIQRDTQARRHDGRFRVSPCGRPADDVVHFHTKIRPLNFWSMPSFLRKNQMRDL